MNILNLGCGYPRLKPPFLNLDSLFSQFPVGTLERKQLIEEGNYVDHNVTSGPLPFEDCSFDAILASHFLEHFDAQSGLSVLYECLRVLKSGGSLLVSVPDTSYFRKVFHEDTKENGMRLFGESMDSGNPHKSFFSCALWFNEHLAILTEDAVWAYLTKAGFSNIERLDPNVYDGGDPAVKTMHDALNRRQFSLVMKGTKP